MSRQEKLAESSRILKGLQEELLMEDNKFKEAVKAAEDNARLTEVNIFFHSCIFMYLQWLYSYICLRAILGESGCRDEQSDRSRSATHLSKE